MSKKLGEHWDEQDAKVYYMYWVKELNWIYEDGHEKDGGVI